MSHTCHWPTCSRATPPSMWGCKKHWLKLPADIRKRIWDTYVPGQEITKTPSKEYLQAADAANKWIIEEIEAGRQT